jgi:hypothetical protein
VAAAHAESARNGIEPQALDRQTLGGDFYKNGTGHGAGPDGANHPVMESCTLARLQARGIHRVAIARSRQHPGPADADLDLAIAGAGLDGDPVAVDQLQADAEFCLPRRLAQSSSVNTYLTRNTRVGSIPGGRV